VRPQRTGNASLHLVAAAESERLRKNQSLQTKIIIDDELCRVVRNDISKRDPERKFKLTEGHADCFARVCGRQLCCSFQPQELRQKYLRGNSHALYSSSHCPGTRPALSVGNTRRYCWLRNPSTQWNIFPHIMASYFCSPNYNRLLSVTYESLFLRQSFKKQFTVSFACT
jgi:hypothetical protein